MKKPRSRMVQAICAVSIILGNILFVSFNGYTTVYFIVVARIVIGLSHGVLYVVLLCHSSENAMAETRGAVVGTVGAVLACGGLIVGVGGSVDNINVFVGTISLVLCGFALLAGVTVHSESAVFLIRKGDYQAAIGHLMRLRSESSISAATQTEYDQLRQDIEHEMGASKNIFVPNNGRSMGLACLLRILGVLTNNCYVNFISMFYVVGLYLTTEESVYVAAILLTGVRLLSVLISTLVADQFGRKPFIWLAGYAGGLMQLASVVYFRTLNLDEIIYNHTWLIAGFALSQACFGYGLDNMPHVVVAESFAHSKRSFSIAFISTVVHVVFIGSFLLFYHFGLANYEGVYANINTVMIVATLLVLGLTGCLHWLLPETRMVPVSGGPKRNRGSDASSTYEGEYRVNEISI